MIDMDLIVPIRQVTETGHRFIETVVDYASRYPESVALKKITSEVLAGALVSIYSQDGVPKSLTDLGTEFVSDIMKEVRRVLSIKQLLTTLNHPACNGLVSGLMLL
ncbi:uncharacterized protein LOC144356698 [Saccoglossus kowalevskii]